MAEIQVDTLTRDLKGVPVEQGPEKPVKSSVGSFELPFIYNDASLLALIYRVTPEKVQTLLGDLPLEPLVSLGKVAVILGIFEYRDSTLGRYYEVSLGAQVRRKGSRPSSLRVIRDPESVEDAGIYIFNLPLTEKEPCMAGQQIWGYPKYVTDIQTSFGKNRVDAELVDEFSLTQTSNFGPTVKGVPFVTYTMHNRQLVRTVMEANYRAKIGWGNRVQLKLLGQGPTANTIKMLGLDQMRCFLTLRTNEMQCVLPEGQVLAPMG